MTWIGFGLRLGRERGSVDAVSPTCVITANASGITAGAFTATLTFSEDVVGFLVGNITAKQNTVAAPSILSDFMAVSGSVYTCVVTPDTAGTVTLEVAAGVCVDGAGNANEASNVFSILSAVGFVRVKNYSDPATLWKDAGRTSPVTANDDVVQGLTGLEASPNHDLASTTGPKYKINLIGSKPGLYFDSAVPNFLRDDGGANIVGTNSWTRIFAQKQDAGATLSGIQGSGSANGTRVWNNSTEKVQFNTDLPASQPGITPTNWNLIILQYNAGTGKVRVRFNNSATWYEATVSTYVSSIIQYFTARDTTGPLFKGHAAGWDLIAPSVLSDAVIDAFRDYNNSYLDEVFF